MDIISDQQRKRRTLRRKRRRKKILVRYILLAISCIFLFLVGQLLGNTFQMVKNTAIDILPQPYVSALGFDENNKDQEDRGSNFAADYKEEKAAIDHSSSKLDKEEKTPIDPSSKGIDKEEKEVQENTKMKKTSWNLILANPWNKVPDDFSVNLSTLRSGHSVDERAATHLQEMLNDARAEGLSPIICSSFRSMDKQQSLFNNKVNRYISQGFSKEEAEKEAAKSVAVPGTSEHQTGLAVDIVAKSYQLLNEEQENTAEQQWLMKNSHKYGFILRYPKGKSNITGIKYEPWHYRYVGKEAAKEITEQGITFEEYLES